MSFKTCLLVSALLLPACIDPAKQGMTTAASEDTSSSGSTTTGNTGPTTGVATSDDSNTSIASTDPGGSCDDGKQNQDESDVDCGGSKCPLCDGEAMCGADTDCQSGECEGSKCFPLVRSCLELNAARPDLPSDAYPLDPDGDGANPTDFFCDMQPESPGWTQVFIDEFDPGPVMGVWDPVVEGECGDFGAILGPYGMGSSATLGITAQKVPHTEVRVVANVVIMDSWDAFDNDLIIVKLNGNDLYSQGCDSQTSFTCGQMMNVCGDPGFNDAGLPLPLPLATYDGDDITLEFTSNLNEPVANESFGLDKVVVFVK